LKEAFDLISEAEDKAKHIDLSSPLTNFLPTHLDKLSDTLRKKILDLKITTISEFLAVGVDGIKTELEKPKYKIPFKDLPAISRLETIIRERVEEKELYE